MKKLFLMACAAMLLVGCGGSGNAYVDEVVSISEDYADKFGDAEDTKELGRMTEDYYDALRQAEKDYSAEKKEFERGLEDFDDDAHEADVKYRIAQMKAMFYIGKARAELKEKEKK